MTQWPSPPPGHQLRREAGGVLGERNLHQLGWEDLLDKPAVESTFISEYASITSALAKQRVGYWDSFEGLYTDAAETQTKSFERFTINANATGSSTNFVTDAITGKVYLDLWNTTTATSICSIYAGNGNANDSKLRAAENPWMKFLILQTTAPIGGTSAIYLGLRNTVGGATNHVLGIYFRSINGGNWFLVCRDVTGAVDDGNEATLDMGVAPSSTLILLEFRVTGDGTRVEGYYNGNKIGSITTKIPTGLLFQIVAGCPLVATVTTKPRYGLYGWGWEHDLIA